MFGVEELDGKLELYSEQDVLRERASLWKERFALHFKKIPKKPKGLECVWEMYTTEPDPPEGISPEDIGTVIYLDIQSGRALKKFSVFDNWYGRPRKFEREISEYHSRQVVYKLLGGQEVEAEEVFIKTWRADKNWRRISKEECLRQIVIPDKGWSPNLREPRRVMTLLEESIFEPTESKDSVTRPSQWQENLRTLFQGGQTYYYASDDKGFLRRYEIVFDGERHFAAQWVTDNTSGLIPNTLGEADTILF